MVLPLVPQDATVLTETRARQTILARVEFENTDVREALRSLLREGRFGGTAAPDVQGTITVSLRNVPFETALQQVVRQVEATYRIDHGWFEVVRRPEETPQPSDDRAYDEGQRARWNALEARYARLRQWVDTGRGREIRASFAPDFRFQDATETRQGEAAARAVIDGFRAYPRLRIVSARETGKQTFRNEVVTAYDRPGAATRYFRDVWTKDGAGRERLALREETVLDAPSLRYVDAPLSRVLRDLSIRTGVTIRLDSRLDRRVTLDLAGLPFEMALQRLTQDARLTYRIEGGVYFVVPNP